MFWGVILNPGKGYTTVVDRPFHVTGAALDFKKPEDKACVKATVKDLEFIICYLNGADTPQRSLDLPFELGEEVTFVASGNANVHLTGVSDPVEMMSDNESEDEEPEKMNEVKNRKKRKAAEEAVHVIHKRLKSLKDEESDEEDESFRVPADAESDDDEGTSDDEDDELDEEEEGEDEDEDMGEDDLEMDSNDESEEEEEDEEEEEKPKKGKDQKGMKQAEKKKSEAPKAEAKKSQVAHNDTPALNGHPDSEKKNKKKSKNKENTSPTKDSSGNAKSPVSASKGLQAHPNKGNQSPAGKTINKGGVNITTLHPGNGPVAKDGKRVHVYYRGRLKATNEEFDSNTSGKGFSFVLGKGEVIKGWEKGVEGMKVGEKRRVEVPPKLGYGAKGSKPEIPPNATLLFDIELKAVS
jgi:FK506-binding nuclear protein